MSKWKVVVFDPKERERIYKTTVEAENDTEAKKKVLESFRVYTYTILEERRYE